MNNMSYLLRKGPYDQFLLFGDSITEQSANQDRGFAFMPALQNEYIRRLDVVNRGFSGYNTSQALIALPLFMPSPEQARLRYMVIFFGANDACLPSSSTGQHVPLQRYKENLKAIVEHPLIQKQQPRLILITPPPINEYQLQADLALVGVTEVQRTAEHTAKYAYACREVGESLRIPVLDLWSTFIERAGWQKGESLPGSKVVANNEFLSAALLDGLHLTPVGYRCLFDDIMILIRKTYPEKASVHNSYMLPLWRVAPGLENI